MSNITTSYVSWLSIVNLFTNIIASCEIVLGLIYILIILYNQTHRSVSNYLAINTAVSIVFYAVTLLLISIRIWQCDNYADQCIEDNACFFRDYINDVASTAGIYSFTVQSIHYLLAAVFINNVHLQMYQLRLILCIIQWVVAFLFPVYFIYLIPQLRYDPVSYVCVVSENSSLFLTLYLLFIGFLMPVMVAISIYIKLFLFVRQLRRSAIAAGLSTIISSKHELHMVKRILLILGILAVGSLPEIIFESMKTPPDYRYRVYYLSVTIAAFCCLICLFAFTPLVRQRMIIWKKKIKTAIKCRKERAIAPEENRH